MREYRFIIVALIILAVSVTAVETISTASGTISPLDQTLTFVFSPFQKAITGIGNFASGLLNIASSEEKQKNLEDQVYLLKQEVARLQMEKTENEKLRRLLRFKENLPEKTIPAEVFERDPSEWFQNLTINQGTDSGVLPDQGVVGSEGVVGKISEVSAGSARVTLVTNPRMAFPVEILPGGSQGIIYGKGEDGCVVRYISLDALIKPGDHVVTSGLGHIFKQKGIPVGVVMDVKPDPERIYFKIAAVRPFVNSRNVSNVLVIQP